MPTLLDLAGAPIPETCAGSSLLDLLRGEGTPWRERLHGEMAQCGGEPTGMHYLTDGNMKYIWEYGLRRELLFDLETDPQECRNLADDPAWRDRLLDWRADLIERLRERPEGFVKDGKLVCFNGPMPWAREDLLDQGSSLADWVLREKPLPTGFLE